MASHPAHRITSAQTRRKPASRAKAERTAEEFSAKATKVGLPTPSPVDDVFRVLSPETLSDIATYLRWDPILTPARHTKSLVADGKVARRPKTEKGAAESGKPFISLSQLETQKKLAWLDEHRAELAEEVSAVGSHTFWRKKPYSEIVRSLAKKLGLKFSSTDAVPDIEQSILKKLVEDACAKLKPEQRAEIEQVAAKLGTNLKGEMVGFATLGTAQLSGFGAYALGSTLLGAINGALGLGLGFGVFAGLSELVAVAIGPPGWVVIGLVVVAKLGAPNYKKLLPVIILISLERQWLASASIELTAGLPTSKRRAGPSALPITTAREPSLTLAEAEAIVEREYDLIAQEHDCPNYSSLGEMGKELVRQIHSQSLGIAGPHPKSRTNNR